MGAIVGKLQIGKETVPGTAVTATRLIPIVLKPLPVDRKVIALSQDIGKNVEVTGSLVQGRLVQDTLSWDQGAFELLPYLFCGCLKGGLAPSEQTPGAGDYLWTPEPNLDETTNNQDTFTLQRGDNIQAFIHAFTAFKTIKMSGQVNQDGGESVIKVEADYFAKENAIGAFSTIGVTTLPQTFMNAKLMQLFMDPLWANAGITEMTNFLRSFDLQITGGLYPMFNSSTQETFDELGQGPISFLLNLTVVRSATTESLRSAIGSTRTVRLAINGPVIGVGGKNQLCQLDLFGYIEDVVPMASNDRSKSANLDTLVLHGMIDPVSGKMISPKISTDVELL